MKIAAVKMKASINPRDPLRNLSKSCGGLSLTGPQRCNEKRSEGRADARPNVSEVFTAAMRSK